MAKYDITLAVLLERWDEETLTQLTDGEASPDETLVDKMIVLAEDEFEGYAGVYYALPVRTSGGTVPPVVRTKLTDAVMWFLASRKPEWVAEGAEQANTFVRIRKELNDWFKGLAAGAARNRIRIPDAVERTISEAAGAGAWAESGEARYTKSDTGGVF